MRFQQFPQALRLLIFLNRILMHSEFMFSLDGIKQRTENGNIELVS